MVWFAEEVAKGVAELTFRREWKKIQKSFLKLDWFKGRKKELKDELLFFLFFVGDLGIFVANLENKVKVQRIRDAYQGHWADFARQVSKTVMQNKANRFKEYRLALEKKDEEKSFAETLGRQFTKCCNAEGIDVWMLASSFCNTRMMAIIDLIREMDHSNGID